MVFLDESRLSWLPPLRRLTEKKVSSGDTSDDDCWRAFDIADDMEKGFARELVFDFTQPLPPSTSLWKFQVERAANKLEYRLYCNGGEFLMYAKLARDGRRAEIFLYDPLERENSLYNPDRPAFTMVGTAHGHWTMLQDRCDLCRHSRHAFCSSCRGKQSEVMTVQHTKEDVGEGISHCMDVAFPLDSRWQDECGPEVCNTPRKEAQLITKLPVWNERVESLVLDFQGRTVQASAKNFQLALEDEPEHVVCQYAKIGTDTFGLDFKYPLTVAQAFAMSLTTLHWA